MRIVMYAVVVIASLLGGAIAQKIFEIIKTLVLTDKLRSMLERNDIPII